MNRQQRRAQKSKSSTPSGGGSGFVSALFLQGFQSYQAGRVDEARHFFHQILIQEPQHAQSLYMCGVIAMQKPDYQAAEKLMREAIAAKGDAAEFYDALGSILRGLKKYEASIAAYKKALSLKPDFVSCKNNLGNLYKNLGTSFKHKGLMVEGLALYESILETEPDSFEALNNLSVIHNRLENFEKAFDCAQRALAIQPKDYKILSNIAGILKNMGRVDEAIPYYKQAITIAPDQGELRSNLLLTMNYTPSISVEEIFTTAREFGVQLADPLPRKVLSNNTDPDRKLRVGYVSPDFCDHAVHYFFESLLKLHDRNHFEVFAYSDTHLEDEVTERLRKEFDAWCDVQSFSDDVLAGFIVADKIDILVDLTGHTARNRLLAFARKPAPVQITWLGYPGTTGVKAMNYRISDSYAEPPGMTEHLNVETLWRLPDIFCCYQAHENSPEVINHPPFEDNEYITFGCFNNFSKISDDVLRAWMKILAQVPESRLLLEIKGIDKTIFRQETEERLQRLGLPLERIILEPRKKSNQFVLYNRIDIALDPFPCNGGTTSMDTVWMGVPFVTLAGQHFVSRMGVTILTNAGLPELITNSVEEYIDCAVTLANDRVRLKKMRSGLRERVAASPLMDQKAFAKNMEDAYRQMWQKWCADNS